jgi:quinol monooxygenase YgiN
MALALIVTHVLLPGHEDAFDALVARTLEGIRADEPGTLIYVSHVAVDPPRRILYELYADREAFAAHERQPHVRHFLTERPEHVESVEVDFLDAVAGTARAITVP